MLTNLIHLLFYDYHYWVFLDRRVGAQDLRLKLQKKNNQQAIGGVRDLREKLSGITYSKPSVAAPAKPKAAPESSKPARKSIVAEAPVAETKKVASTVSKKKKVCLLLPFNLTKWAGSLTYLKVCFWCVG